jgi:hypothetical protein
MGWLHSKQYRRNDHFTVVSKFVCSIPFALMTMNLTNLAKSVVNDKNMKILSVIVGERSEM